MEWLQHLWYWIEIHTGTVNEPGPYYGFWSGFGSDLGEVTLVVAVVAWYKTNQCHVDSCHKIGKHPFKHYKLCRKHHPDIPNHLTHAHILKLHKDDIIKSSKKEK